MKVNPFTDAQTQILLDALDNERKEQEKAIAIHNALPLGQRHAAVAGSLADRMNEIEKLISLIDEA